jgi:hypothetical protein
MYGVGAATFAPALKRYLDQHFPGGLYRFTGDPKGQDRGQADERTAYDVFRAHGMPVSPAPVKNNHIQTRITAVEQALNELVNGGPRLVIDPLNCPTLVAGMSGKYQMRKLMLGDDPTPEKDKYSDIADCLQYMVLFLGNGRVLNGLLVDSKPKYMKVARPEKSMRRINEA